MGHCLLKESGISVHPWVTRTDCDEASLYSQAIADEDPYSPLSEVDALFARKTRKHGHDFFMTSACQQVKAAPRSAGGVDLFWIAAEKYLVEPEPITLPVAHCVGYEVLDPLDIDTVFDVVKGSFSCVKQQTLPWVDVIAQLPPIQVPDPLLIHVPLENSCAELQEDGLRNRYLELKAIDRSGKLSREQADELLSIEEILDAEDEKDPLFVSNAEELRRDNERLGVILEMEHLLDKLRGYRAEVRETTNSSSI